MVEKLGILRILKRFFRKNGAIIKKEIKKFCDKEGSGILIMASVWAENFNQYGNTIELDIFRVLKFPWKTGES